ncbi:MAG: nuclear transport factor 2 family protein [Bryobacteraceae bacterium]
MRIAGMLMAAALAVAPGWAGDLTEELVALERRALDGWLKGDPEPALAAMDPDVTYYHVISEQRIEGLAALKEIFERYRGRPLFDSYEIRGAKVRTVGDAAVLTYQLGQRVGENTSYWNGTVVFGKTEAGWRVVHVHWSAVRA